MVSFIISLLALLAGYFFYGKVVERVFGPDKNRPTPAVAHPDGVDYVPMPTWRVFMIQFLNIAGTGPIFGAIMGAKFGPSAYLWIVFGCILLVFSLLLLVLVGAVFVYSPAIILGSIFGSGGSLAILSWVVLIFFYYVIATMLPIDKIIGKIYPLFAVALIFMAIGLLGGLIVKWPSIPEFWDGLQNRGPSIGMEGQSIFPCLFITIACGAISGFHATQSPMMARCMKSEKLGRPIFYGAMITEGLVALVWAAVASYFFFDGGAAEVGSDISAAAPTVVTKISTAWLGTIGGILAILGVVAAPITTGDTALRSARLTLAEALKLDQKPVGNRLRICIPLFAIVALLIWYNIADENGFNTIWRYFGWANQTLSIFTLWAITVYLAKTKGKHWHLITEIPALFMTVVCLTYILTQKIGLGLPMWAGAGIAAVVALSLDLLFYSKVRRKR